MVSPSTNSELRLEGCSVILSWSPPPSISSATLAFSLLEMSWQRCSSRRSMFRMCSTFRAEFSRCGLKPLVHENLTSCGREGMGLNETVKPGLRQSPS